METPPKRKISLSFIAVASIVVTALSKAASFLRVALLAAIFGTSWETDAFYMATTISNLFIGFTSNISTIVVPMRAKLIVENGRAHADKILSSLLNMFLVINVSMGICLCVMAPKLVQVFAPSYAQGSDAFLLTVAILRIFTPIYLIAAVTNFVVGVLSAENRHIAVAAMAFGSNLGWMLFSLFLADRLGIFAMVLGYLIGLLLQLVILLPRLRGIFCYSISFQWRSQGVRQALALFFPLFMGSLSFSLQSIIDKALASGLDAGSVSALGYSYQLVAIVLGTIVAPLSASLFTPLSSIAQAGDQKTMNALLLRGFSAMSIILIPATFLIFVFHQEFVQVVFVRGAFDEAASRMTSHALKFYVWELFPLGLVTIATRFFHAMSNTRDPLIINIIAVIVGVALDFALIGPMGIGGLALGSSIASALLAILLVCLLRKRIGPMGLLIYLKNMSKIGIAMLGMAAVAIPLHLFVKFTPLITLAIAVPIGCIVYVVILYLARESEIRTLVAALLSWIEKRSRVLQ